MRVPVLEGTSEAVVVTVADDFARSMRADNETLAEAARRIAVDHHLRGVIRYGPGLRLTAPTRLT